MIKPETITALERRLPRHAGQGIRILIAVVVAMSALVIGGGITRDAAAVTTWSGAAGWMGNRVIYMTTWISSVPDSKGFGSYALPEWNVSSRAQSWCPNGCLDVNNSIGVAVGVRSADANANLMFYEFYNSVGGFLEVYIPVAVIGASYTSTGLGDVECLYESIQNNYLPHVGMQVLQADNFGINATGTLDDAGTPPIQNAQNNLMADAFWTGVEALLAGTPVGTWKSMYQTYVTAAKAVASPNVEHFDLSSPSAGQMVIHSYNARDMIPWYGYGPQSPNYNVFGAST